MYSINTIYKNMSRKGTKKLIPPLLNFELGNQMELGI